MKKIFIHLFILLVSFTSFAQKKHHTKTGIASFYHQKFHGKKTASGEIFNNQNLTAASNYFALGTKVLVTNLKNNKQVFVLINDRMAKHTKRLIDLTYAAANQLEFIALGMCKVKVEIVNNEVEND